MSDRPCDDAGDVLKDGDLAMACGGDQDDRGSDCPYRGTDCNGDILTCPHYAENQSRCTFG
ncbi:MAG TPA: hypothetical protein PKM88_05660 [bacterium]|nr:hypothetical protein [bacterium]